MSITVTFEQGTGYNPRIVRIVTDSTLTQVTTAGWLNSAVSEGILILPTDQLLISYSGGVNFFSQSVSAGVYTVSIASSSVVLPTIANHIAVYANVAGGLTEDAATAINGGNLQAGLSGTAGTVASFPSTSAKGSLVLAAVANTGDTLVTISNAAHGQASVYSIPDSGASTANLLISKLTGTQHITVGSLAVDAGLLVSGISTGGQVGTLQLFATTASTGGMRMLAAANGGNFNVDITNASHGQSTVYTMADIGAATGGIPVATAPVKMKAVALAAVAGGAAAQTVTDAFCTATSSVVCTWNDTTNAVSIQKAVAGNGSFVVTSSGDPGSSHLNYIITK